MGILSDALMKMLQSFQQQSAVLAYAGGEGFYSDIESYSCRASCSGDCDDSCRGGCEGDCAGSCLDSCSGSCESSVTCEDYDW